MTTVPEKDQTQKIRVTESVAKLLRDKDRIICMQAKRIDILERELLKFRKERDSLACQVSDLTDRISMDYSIEEIDKEKYLPSERIVKKTTTTTLQAGNCNSLKFQRSTGQLESSYSKEAQNNLHRCWANAYELSQELHDKQVEILQRKYGGRELTTNAASVIQHAYRRHCMRKNFNLLRSQDGQSTRRRFAEIGRSRSVLAEMTSTPATSKNADVATWNLGGATVRVSSSQSMVHRSFVMQKSSSLNLNVTPPRHHYPLPTSTKNDLCSIVEGRDIRQEDCVDGDLNDSTLTRFTGRNPAVVDANSPIWKRKDQPQQRSKQPPAVPKRNAPATPPNSTTTTPVTSTLRPPLLTNGDRLRRDSDRISDTSSDTASLGSDKGMMYQSSFAISSNSSLNSSNSNFTTPTSTPTFSTSTSSLNSCPSEFQRLPDRQRKRLYRIGLNIFNKKPEKGIVYLIEKGFIDRTPQQVARFLITRKGLSKQMIGEYLGHITNEFNSQVLDYFTTEIDLCGMQLDVALRLFQTYFRMPGEAQKIQRLMEAFAERFAECNADLMQRFKDPSSAFMLAYAIIMLNTDLHNKSIKSEKRMKLVDFIKNLRGLDAGEDMDYDLLCGIYKRIAHCEFKPGTDHVSQVDTVEKITQGMKQPLALSHRRLVCYCRLYEVIDPNKKERPGRHQREVFLFNDTLMVTKTAPKKSKPITYLFREFFMLCGMQVYLFETSHYKYGIRLATNIDGKVLMTFNARHEGDRIKFVDDLKEAIIEMNEMEQIRINEEINKQTKFNSFTNRHSKDSGVIDCALDKNGVFLTTNRLSEPDCLNVLKKNARSSSLIDLNTDTSPSRRNSGASLDSGLESTNSGSRDLKTTTTSAATVKDVKKKFK